MPQQEPNILTTAAGDRIILATQGGGRDHQCPDRRELRGRRARRQLVRERQDHPGTVLRPRGMSHVVESRAGVRRHPNHPGLAACRCRPVVQMGQDGETGGTTWIAQMEQTLRAHVLTCTGTQFHSPLVVFGQQAADTSG